ncbi:MAG: hypothetical protein FIB01_06740 [Gemmatimonadetes bacterium]|nr:hypothetical protein [Gemmatimonadota bacterium]
MPRLHAAVAAVVACSLCAAAPASGQSGGLRARFGQLFTFGSGCGADVLFCLKSGSGTPDFAQEAFSTNANATARELTVFLQAAIAQGIATVPAPSAGSGETFRLSELGVPVRNEETSLGPILADRAVTLGQGKFLIGANLTTLRFEQLRGVSLDGLEFNVVQRDLPPTGPPLGDPAIERTYLAVATHLGFDASVANLFFTAGITDRLDLSVLVPVVRVTLSGFSDARIMIGAGDDPAAGFSFGGPAEDPKLQERSVLDRQEATGLGAVALKAKYRLTATESRVGLAVIGDVRLPTAKDEDFLGPGGVWAGASGVFSADLGGGFATNGNLGAALRGGDGQRNALVAALGVDHRTSARLTLAAEALAQVPFGSRQLVRREVSIRDAQGTTRQVATSNLPTLRDHQLDGSLGFKFRLGQFALVGSALVPLNDGGLRGNVLWTIGLQGGF